jgi:hypothetical protein
MNVGRSTWDDTPTLVSIEVTKTRKGMWFTTFPCGEHIVIGAHYNAQEARYIAGKHRGSCDPCRRAKIIVDQS